MFLFLIMFKSAGKNELSSVMLVYLWGVSWWGLFSGNVGDGQVRMPLPIDNTVLAIDSKGTFCLAFATAGAPGNVSIVGNVQQQNFKVEYDLTNNKIGFAPTDCGDQDQD